MPKKNPINEASAKELTKINPDDEPWHYFFALNGIDGNPTFFVKREKGVLDAAVNQNKKSLVKQEWFEKGELTKEDDSGNVLVFRPKEFGNLNAGRKDYEGKSAKFTALLIDAMGTNFKAKVVYSD